MKYQMTARRGCPFFTSGGSYTKIQANQSNIDEEKDLEEIFKLLLFLYLENKAVTD